jgi:ferredoxin
MTELRDPLSVNETACVRCGACSTIAPEIFELRAKGSVIRRVPADDRERARAAVAARICPTSAIRAGDALVAPRAADAPRANDFLGDALYYELFDEAEKARWRVADVPLHAVAKDRVSPALVEMVRANAASEMTTFTASRRFLQEFADDPDFSQWITIWAYEETKHPQILMRWLAVLGETFDAAFVMKGRWASPFARSRASMLTTNVISEMVASAGYVRLARPPASPRAARVAQRPGEDGASGSQAPRDEPAQGRGLRASARVTRAPRAHLRRRRGARR